MLQKVFGNGERGLFALYMLLVLAAFTFLMAVVVSGSARASHLEDQEDEGLYALSCKELYYVRNKFFHEKGLCFTRPTAIRMFGNVGCKHVTSDTMPMSPRETRLMAVVVEVERDKRCPRY